jgi:hypothetical protein
MSRRSTGRKRTSKDIPKTVNLPKFLSPGDLKEIVRVKRRAPTMSWSDAVDRVIFRSVADLESILT